MEHMSSDAIVHVAVVVRDAVKASRLFAKIFGKPVPEVMETAGYAESKAVYRGGPTEGRAKLAFFQAGPNLTFEIAEPLGGPSTWSEFLEKQGPGIHHVGIFLKGMKENVGFLEANGAETVQTGVYPGGRYAYCDCREQIGAILELLENE